jgi:L-cysteine desulfidase
VKDFMIRTLRQELKPALGCTEPIAIALATAHAAKHFNGELKAIELELSGNMLKNAMGVGIPGTDGKIGIDLAAVLGVVAGNADKALEALEDITKEDVDKSVEITKKDIVTINVSSRPEKLYVYGKLIAEDGSFVEAEIINVHDRLVSITSDKGVIFQLEEKEETAVEIKSEDLKTSIKDIYDFAMSVDIEEVRFVLEGMKLNVALAEDGLNKAYGLQVGRAIQSNIEKGVLSDDYKNSALMNTAAAIDARMAGSKLAAMSNSGSGDQGITAFVPVATIWKKIEGTEEQLIRALVLSNLVPIHIKKQLGRLSAICGATVAGVGAAVGTVYLLGGTYEQMLMAINNQIGGITGLFCDGAKNSCAMKAANSVDAAFNAAVTALNGFGIQGYEGIVDYDVEKSIQNMAVLGSEGMQRTDEMILEIMVNKTK